MHQSQIICKHQLLPTLYCARPCMCRHEYHTMAQITSRACILHQCIQWFFYLPSSDKTVGTLRHFLPNLTLVLTIHDIHDCRSVGERTTCYSTFIFWPPPPPPISLLVNQWVYIWNGYLHSCGILCAVTCCFLHNVLKWCTGCIFKGQGSRKHRSATVFRSLIKLNTEPCLGISMQFRIA